MCNLWPSGIKRINIRGKPKASIPVRLIWSMLGLLALIFLLGPVAAIADVAVPEPAPELYVLDQAGVISDETKSMIINTSRDLATQTKAQAAVVTLNTLEGQEIEDVALAIGRQWQLGDKELNNGLLILVVPSERKARIEIGYGLEGALPDAKTGRIQDQHMLPAFEQGNYDLGISNGYKALIAEVAGEYGVTVNIAEESQPAAKEPAPREVPAWQIILGAFVIMLLIWLDMRFFNGFFLGLIIGLLSRGRGGGGGGFGGGGSRGGGGSFGGGGSSRGW